MRKVQLRRALALPAVIAIAVLSFSGLSSCVNTPGSHVYLTWNENSTSTGMTVNYHSPGDEPADTKEALYVYYGEFSAGGDITNYPFRMLLPGTYSSTGKRMVYSADLSGLSPDTLYYFVIGDALRPLTEEETFRTLPNDPLSEIRFVVGGDMGLGRTVSRMERLASRSDPMFALIGGDVTYDNGKPENYHFWDKWLHSWSENMRRSDGSLVPIVMAVGNHEVRGGYHAGTPLAAPGFHDYFMPNEGRTYYSRHFGAHTALYVLDSDHITPIEGEQTAWLRNSLSEDTELPNRFALYHVPLYPSVRSPGGDISVRARVNWGSLFDEFRLTIGFENHDHALKRTHPLRGGKFAPGGTVYLGDGSWGIRPRQVEKDRPYLANAEATRHFWAVSASRANVRAYAIDAWGRVRDSAEIAHE